MNTKTDNNSARMQLKVNVNFPTYFTDNMSKLEVESKKMNIESLLLNLYSQTILTEKYAKTILDINIDVIEYNCDIINFAVMAITLVLNYANIEQKGLISCSNLIIVKNEIIIDPTFEEENNSEFKLILGTILDLKETNVFLQKGKIDEKAFKLCVATSFKVCENYKNLLIEKL